MTSQFTDIVVRVFCGNAVVGAGYVIAPGHVMTCAHVINNALGRKLNIETEPLDRTVEIDLPWFKDGHRQARIVAWSFPSIDAAVLKLDDDPADTPTPRAHAILANPIDQSFRASGFPEGFDVGRIEKGVVNGIATNDYLEIRPADGHDYFVEQGFSGSPAVTEDGRILGMVVATGPAPEKRLAYLIPPRQLERVWPPIATPYRGLHAFGEDDTYWFRGRKEFVELTLKKLKSEPVVALVGASGSGKSSIVRAGVIPQLRRENWLIATCRIGADPCRNFAQALVELLYPNEDLGTRFDHVEKIAGEVRNSPKTTSCRIKDLFRIQPDAKLFVLLDQFEELITQAPDDERVAFDSFLTQVTGDAAQNGLRLVLTLRSDYEDDIARLVCGRKLLNNACVRLTPMNRCELTAAVCGPAEELGVTFESGRDWDMISAVEQNDALLPLLQYALQELWWRQQNRRIPDAVFSDIGGLEGVLAKKADEVLYKLNDADRERAQRLFSHHLVNVSEGGLAHDTKATASRGNLGENLWSVAQKFADEGVWLLVIRQPGDSNPADAVVEIVHEALIRNWRQLAEWLDAVREVRVWQATMRREMVDWGERYSDTWNDNEVARARTMLGSTENSIDEDVRNYAEQMIGNTEAASLWRDLQSVMNRNRALLAIAGASPWTRKAIFQNLMQDELCAETFVELPDVLSTAIFGLDIERKQSARRLLYGFDPRTSNPLTTRCHAMLGVYLSISPPPDFLFTSLCKTTAPEECRALGQAIIAIAPQLSDADERFDALLSTLRQTVDRYQCQSLGQAMVAIVPLLADVEGRFEELCSALQEATDRHQCDALGRIIAEVVPSLAEAEQHLDVLFAALHKTFDFFSSRALERAIISVVAQLADAEGYVDVWFAALRETEHPGQCRILGKAMAAIAPRLADADCHVDAWFAALLETGDPDQCRALGEAMAAIAPQLADADRHVDAWVAALRETEDSDKSSALGHAIAAIAPQLTDTEQYVDAWFAALRETEDSDKSSALGHAIAATAPKLIDASTRADALVAALAEIDDPDQCHALGQKIIAIAPKLKDAEKRVEALLAASRTIDDPDQCDALVKAIVAIVPQLSDAKKHVDAWFFALLEAKDPVQRRVLGQVMAAIAPRLADAEQYINDWFVALLAADDDPVQCRAIGQAIAAIAPQISDPEAIAEACFSTLREVDDPYQCNALGQIIAAIAPQLADKEQHVAAWFSALIETDDPDQCRALGQAMAAIAPQLANTEKYAEAWFSALRETSNPHRSDALGQAIVAMAPQLDNEKCADGFLSALRETTDPYQCLTLISAINAWVQTLIDGGASLSEKWFCMIFGVLRHPWASKQRLPGLPIYKRTKRRRILSRRNKLQDTILTALGLTTGHDLWDAVACFKEIFPDVNLSAPWPEPLQPQLIPNQQTDINKIVK